MQQPELICECLATTSEAIQGNEWLLSCYELNISKVPLETEDMNEAKEKALVEMAEFFNKMVQKYKKAIEELKVKI